MSFDIARRALRRHGVWSGHVDAFLRWHKARPEVWREFEKVARIGIRRGRRSWTVKEAMAVVRWRLERRTVRWKIDERYGGYYAILFCAKYPTFARYFKVGRHREASDGRVRD